MMGSAGRTNRMHVAGHALLLILMVGLLVAGCNSQPTPEAETDDFPDERLENEAIQETDEDLSAIADVHVFHNVNLITMTDNQVMKNQSVVIQDGIITEIGDTERVVVPDEAYLIDGEGKYLMPGLVDMHVHWWHYQGEEILYLANGVTAVQNMWGHPTTLRLRKSVNEGSVLAPRIFTTGPIMDGPDPIWADSLVISTPEEAREAVVSVKEAGYDAVKIYEMLSLEVYREIMKTAVEMDMKVVGHTPRQVGIREVLEQGQHSIEHLSGYTLENFEEEAAMVVENHVWNTPTLAIVNVLKEEEEIQGLAYVPPRTLNLWRNMKREGVFLYNLDIRQSMVGTIHEIGGMLMTGTDANNPYVVPGFSLHDELEYLVGAGLTPFEALRAATYNPAMFLNQSNKWGTVEEGKEADLILLLENPLEDIRNSRTLTGTMIRGKWLSEEWLEEELEKLRYKY